MSELFDKTSECTKREFEEKLVESMKKCAMQKNKKYKHVRMLLMEEALSKIYTKNW